MLKKILTISGKPGLYKLINHGKNMLIVESLSDKKRSPIYSRDKVMSLGDIAIYTETEEKPLHEVFGSIKEKHNGEKIDMSSFKDDSSIRKHFEEILPDFDKERVYTNDIKKVFNWYNHLLDAGVDYYQELEESENKDEKSENSDNQ
ncbi:MAG: DUF5606 domain-containing protein [Paramuribaculum sp.]|nr:DUF5606 domain-containing protein [Paramuribaculum sp.]